MKVFILPFGKISVIEPNIAEVIINEGVLIDESIVNIYRKVLQSHFEKPISLLINKENAYSYTFDAQVAMGELSDVIAFRAVVVYSLSAEMATQIVMDINKHNNWKIKIFRERQAAIDWLKINQNNKSAM
ncbi:hypothetical protein [uncultured Psychroserpens sp.]|uniref:DUF7793 family protein n=1 Tax=uncultured Psychroserpens sp. TaxID=255436 RepID=UPI002637A6B2|nr:hypothetical protein [uncultured Psychroserpens sp.]